MVPILKQSFQSNEVTEREYEFVRSTCTYKSYEVHSNTSAIPFLYHFTDINKLFGSTWVFLATYYVQYPHTLPFLRNRIPYSLLKTSKPHVVQGGRGTGGGGRGGGETFQMP